MKFTGWSQGLSVTADGTGVVPLAGSAAVRLLADQVGLTAALSAVLTRRNFVPIHDRGRLLIDLARVLRQSARSRRRIEARSWSGPTPPARRIPYWIGSPPTDRFAAGRWSTPSDSR